GGDFPEGQPDFPVTGVSWYEAVAYANWAGKSLPTIYHWARAATTWATPDIVPRSNFGPALQRAGTSGGVSGFGLLDMAGNAKERPKGEEAFRLYAGLYGYDKTPLDARTESVAEADRWRMERISFTAAYRAERMEALLFTPKNVPPPWQTVIFFPGSNALHVRSSKDPTGIYLHACSFLIKSGRALL